MMQRRGVAASGDAESNASERRRGKSDNDSDNDKLGRKSRRRALERGWQADKTFVVTVVTSLAIFLFIVHELAMEYGERSAQQQPPGYNSNVSGGDGNSDNIRRGESFIQRINPFARNRHDASAGDGKSNMRKSFFNRKQDNQQPQPHLPLLLPSQKSPPLMVGRQQRQQRPPVGDFSSQYRLLREEFHSKFLPMNDIGIQHRLQLVQSLRKNTYHLIAADTISNNNVFDQEIDCPLHPLPNYPKAWPLMDIINNWNPDDTTPHLNIYRGICVFDYLTEFDKALNYRRAEVPFVVRDDPAVLQTVERWNYPDYLHRLLSENGGAVGEQGNSSKKRLHRAEYSINNHFMYWMLTKNNNPSSQNNVPLGWARPTELIRMTFDDWLSKANSNLLAAAGPNVEHWYFRLIACGMFRNCDRVTSEFLFDELPFFKPEKSLYMVRPVDQRGIHCRFGMNGVIAENHFDGSRNMIALLGGERRYILSHPNQCKDLVLLPKEHPSGRHSAIDWSDPDLDTYPQFRNARGNEIVLQAGDVLYLPTNWFHYIISLGLNYQCNTRSGTSQEYMQELRDCGF